MVILILLAAILIGILIGLYAAYHKVFYSPKKNMSEIDEPESIGNHPYHDEVRANTKKLMELPCETITTRSYDKLTLFGRYFPGDENKPLIICFHGYHGSALRDCSGIGSYLIREQYPVIFVDERAHRRSGGHTITYGMRERYDVKSWIEYANTRFGKEKPICLFGISLGGATVLMASGQPLPNNVRAIISDCPFNDAEEIIRYVCRLIKLNPTLCWPIIKLSALIYGRFDINKTTAAKEVQKSSTPILIIHGDGDSFVPPYMSAEVQQANPKMVERRLIADAGHGLSYYYAPKQYEAIVSDFINRHTEPKTR